MTQPSMIIHTAIAMLCALSPTASAAQAVDACQSGSTLLMHCTFDDGARQVALCRSGDSVSYAFGADLNQPELSLSSTISEIQNVPFNRVSGGYFEQIRFFNGNTTYEVFASLFEFSSPTERVRRTEGGIRVNTPDGGGAFLTCDEESVTPELPRDGIGQIANGATAGGIDSLSDCVGKADDPVSCLGVVQAADIRDHGCQLGQDWTDCWAHESDVWQAVLAEKEAEAIAALMQKGGQPYGAALSNAQDVWRESTRLDCRLEGTLPFAADAGAARCIAERSAARLNFLRSAVGFAEFDG